MFKRKAYEKLLSWKAESKGKTAILIEGARRVGKTTLVKEFAKREYRDYLYIDFSRVDKNTLDIFNNNRGNIDVFLRMLQLNYGKELKPRNAVVIFDEVQRFPIAREYIKHLVEDGRFDYIETGSLISIKKNVENIVIPSEEERIALEPLDFEEYLWACGQKIYADEIRRCREELEALPNFAHKTCMRLFNEYMLVGGMPQAVAAFIEDADFRRCDKVKRQIIELYKEDIAKFGGSDARKARIIFDDVPGQLSSNSKRFMFGAAEIGSRFEQFESALIWLDDARLINRCNLCNDPNVGYRLHEDSSSLKCYLVDTGLLVSLAFDDGPDLLNVHKDIQFGRISINKGMLVENIVAQQLKALSHSLYYYSWNEPSKTAGARPRKREVDFLLTKGYSNAAGKPRVSPVEVKSSKSYSTVSLDDFAFKYTQRLGKEIVLHPKQLSVVGNREYLPLYMAFCI
jgi:uncharacterized protein